MKYWLIYVDDFSNEQLIQIDLVCYIDHNYASDFFIELENTDDLWYHLVEIKGAA